MSSLILNNNDREQLEEILPTAPIAMQRRIRLLLLYGQGLTTLKASQQAGYSSSQARYWKQQFNLRGMDIFNENIKQNTVEKAPDLGSELIFSPTLSKPGIVPEDLMSEAGRKIMSFQFHEMIKHEAGTIAGEDIEELHDMRVATRRLRAAFDVFGAYFDPKTINPFLQALKTTGRILGAVRDLDVSLEKIRTYTQQLPVERQSGLEALLMNWEGRLDHMRLELLSHLNNPYYLDFKNNFSLFLQTPGLGLVKIKKNTPVQTTVRFLAPTLIYSRLASVMAFDSFVKTASYTQLHALRIEFKKFRYTLEFFSEVLGIEAQTIVDEIKKLQDHLGELNDANVACQNITRFMKKWDQRQNVLPLMERIDPEPVVSYLAYRYAERHQFMISFPDKWQQFTRPDLRQNLSRAVACL